MIPKVITLILIAVGAVIMFLSIVKYAAVIEIVKKTHYIENRNTYKLYSLHRILMILFLIGYVIVLILMFLAPYSLHSLMTGAIFFGGAIFVLVGIVLQSRTLRTMTNQNTTLLNVNEQLLQTENATIFALANLAEVRDKETAQHLERTAEYVRVLGEELRKLSQYRSVLTDEYIMNIVKSSPLHDIGKVGVADSILKKPGRLSMDEFEEMKLHSEYGANILKAAETKLGFDSFLCEAIKIAQSHHEKWDGSGYPEGLKGGDIPLSARIMALADVYDALKTKRCYKDPIAHTRCCDIIKDGSGTHFEPAIVEAFMSRESDFELIAETLKDPD